jgi:hypothetical protein
MRRALSSLTMPVFRVSDSRITNHTKGTVYASVDSPGLRLRFIVQNLGDWEQRNWSSTLEQSREINAESAGSPRVREIRNPAPVRMIVFTNV